MAALLDSSSSATQILAIVTIVLGALPFIVWLKSKQRKNTISDPGLFKKYSSVERYTTPSGLVYPAIRTFFKRHQNIGKLPRDLPLLVFTHGLGGNATQFLPLLNTLINNACCLAIDFPGCGLSDFKPDDANAYTTHALAELVYAAIERFRDAENDQKVVLVGHSMGCSVNALLASTSSSLGHLIQDAVTGMVAICPRSGAMTSKEKLAMQRVLMIPPFIFSIFRWFDRRGGLHSRSINRVVGEDAYDDTRKKQQLYNRQSKSAVFLRILFGMMGNEGLPGKDEWSGIQVPLHLIAGEADVVSPAKECERISEWLRISQQNQVARPSMASESTEVLQSAAEDSLIKEAHVSSKHAFTLKTTIFAAPAAHALLYSTATVRTLAGFIESFLAHHIDERLGATWQLQHLTTSGKWDVKNLTKWKAIDPCSEPIAGIFRAMKTMREVDDEHCPQEFVKKFSAAILPDGVKFVIDISHETPVYDPKGLEARGVEYYKFPTVSKQVPDDEEVENFVKLVDELRAKVDKDATSDDPQAAARFTIGVHCHYGFNRTGVLIICYLVERCGYKLEDAIDEFSTKRPPGIKHEHFKNELFVRYAAKMRQGYGRRGTIVS